MDPKLELMLVQEEIAAEAKKAELERARREQAAAEARQAADEARQAAAERARHTAEAAARAKKMTRLVVSVGVCVVAIGSYLWYRSVEEAKFYPPKVCIVSVNAESYRIENGNCILRYNVYDGISFYTMLKSEYQQKISRLYPGPSTDCTRTQWRVTREFGPGRDLRERICKYTVDD